MDNLLFFLRNVQDALQFKPLESRGSISHYSLWLFLGPLLLDPHLHNCAEGLVDLVSSIDKQRVINCLALFVILLFLRSLVCLLLGLSLLHLGKELVVGSCLIASHWCLRPLVKLL
jgi:hypothetical protein